MTFFNSGGIINVKSCSFYSFFIGGIVVKKFFKKRICSVCGNNVLAHKDNTSILHSRVNGESVAYHDDTTCLGSGKETNPRIGQWIFIAVSVVGSALVIGLKYNHNKAKVLKTN